MRIHIVGVARNPSTPNITVDPYARASYWLTTLLHRKGIEVYYYGHESSTVECTKKFNIVDNKFHNKYFVTEFENTHFNSSHEAQDIFSQKAYEALISNIKENDIIACMWSDQIPKIKSLQELKVKVVDAHIGHLFHYGADYNVFVSVANQHFIYGKYGLEQSRWHDTVIPPICDSINEFEYTEEKENYVLFMARLFEQKGINIFLELAKHFPDKEFVVAGQGNLHEITSDIPSNVKYIGYAHLEERKKLLAKAQAVISPTLYIEPFGLTTIEASLSGTPVIATTWGGYTGNIIEGITGFKCSSIPEFIDAINNLNKINPKNCRKFGEQFTAEALIDNYIKYFNKINQ